MCAEDSCAAPSIDVFQQVNRTLAELVLFILTVRFVMA